MKPGVGRAGIEAAGANRDYSFSPIKLFESHSIHDAVKWLTLFCTGHGPIAKHRLRLRQVQ